MPFSCLRLPLQPPKVVAIAKDGYLKPKFPFPDQANLPPMFVPKYGEDITSSVGRAAPEGQSVGETADELKLKMRKLLGIFASGDKSGMASRLFDAFLKKQSDVTYFEDPALNLAAANHANVKDFCGFALSAPNSAHISGGKKRIHQALRDANWDINKVIIPADLGVPAFNQGEKMLGTGDFKNGLGVMVNGVQYAYVIATNYHYDKNEGKYCITLKFIFYDVFGLDDDDLSEYGSQTGKLHIPVLIPLPLPFPLLQPIIRPTVSLDLPAAAGITAWWQLQHQHGYKPLVTRIVVEKNYEVMAI